MFSPWSQSSEETALTLAACRGHAEMVRLLLQHGAKVNRQVSTAEPSLKSIYQPLRLFSF